MTTCYVIDELDRAILAQMVDDSEINARGLAGRLGIHPNTLFQRIKRLRRNGALLKSTSVLDYDRLGYPTEVLIFLKVNMVNGWEEKLKSISELPYIVSLVHVTGEYDVMAVVRAKNDRELPGIPRTIQGNEVVIKTMTNVVLTRWKRSYEFNPFKC